MAFAFSRALGGAAMLPCIGKQPIVRGYDQFWTEPLPFGTLRHWLRTAGRAVQTSRPGGADAWARIGEGVVQGRTPPRIVVLDIETREPTVVGPLLDMYGHSSLSVRTRRGVHYYYREPEGVEVKSNVFKALDHDIKSRKALCHLPGSIFPGGRYQAEFDGCDLTVEDLLAEPEGVLLDILPTFNVAALEECARDCGFRHRTWQRDDGVERVLDDSEARERGWAYFCAAGPAVEFDGGHFHTRGVLLRLGDIGVPEDVALELALEWDTDNEPRWGAPKIRSYVRDAYQTRRSSVGSRADYFEHVDEDEDVDVELAAMIAALRNSA